MNRRGRKANGRRSRRLDRTKAARFMAAVRAQDVLQVVTSLHRLQPDWRTFFHEVFGLDGILQKAFPDSAARAEFEQTDEYRGIQRMLEDLRPQGAGGKLH